MSGSSTECPREGWKPKCFSPGTSWLRSVIPSEWLRTQRGSASRGTLCLLGQLERGQALMKCSIFLVCVLCVTPAMCQSLENVHSRIVALKTGDKVRNWTVRRVVLRKRIKGSSPVGFYDEVDFVGQATVTGEVANDQTMNSAGPIWNIYIDASTLAKLPTLGSRKSTGSAAVNHNNGFVSAGHIYLRMGSSLIRPFNLSLRRTILLPRL